MPKIDPEEYEKFLKLYPLLKKKCFYGAVDEFGYQVLTKFGLHKKDWEFGYDWVKNRGIAKQDIENHFFHDYKDWGDQLRGGLAFRPAMGDIIKRAGIDADNKETKDWIYKVLNPRCDHLGIEYVFDHGGDNNDRGHWSFYTEANWEVCQAFLRQLLGELGEPIFPEDLKFLDKPKLMLDEVYGGNKTKGKNNVLWRWHYGYHLKRDKRFPMEFQGELKESIIDVIETIVELKPVTQDYMKSYIKDDFFPAADEVKKKLYEGVSFRNGLQYNSLNLKLPVEDIPYKLKKPYKECQAINTLLQRAYDETLPLDERTMQGQGIEYHDAGLAVAGTARSHDLYFSTGQGKEWFFDTLLPETRDRSEKGHNWWFGADKQPATYFWRCDTYDEYFHLCDGCKYKGLVDSPRDFMWTDPISRSVHTPAQRLVTLDYVRNVTFPNFHKAVRKAYDEKRKINYLLASVMGSGKTFSTMQLIKDMVEEDKINVLISVYSVKLALEYDEWFKANGVSSFVLASHDSCFGHQSGKETSLTDISCVYYNEIQEQRKAGVEASSYKEEFCKNCPFYESCPYPTQYTNVMDESYNVVIMQHAHLSCREVLLKLMQKNFSLFVLDETFIDHVYDYVEIDDGEIDLLEGHGEVWTAKLAQWLKGEKKAVGKLTPTKEDYEDIATVFAGWQKIYRVPDLTRFYNQHRMVNKDIGIEIIYELPNIPIKILLDATPPLELTKELTGIRNLQVFGDNEVIDITSIHPDNERIQVIDSINTVTGWNDDEYFEAMLTRICEIIAEAEDELALITVYYSQKKRVYDFIQDKYPLLLSRIDVGLMSRGTNKWAKYSLQFILAGRYRMGKEYLKDAYKFKAVSNFHRVRNHEPLLPNVYPGREIEASASIYKKRKPVEVLMKDKTGKLRLYKYTNHFYWTAGVEGKPDQESFTNPYKMYSTLDKLDIGDMMQIERMRPNSEHSVKIWHFHSKPLPKLMFTSVQTTSEFLAG